jgi:hypothetical protein
VTGPAPRRDEPRDDLGQPAAGVSRPVRRVVSLVPSLTESVAATRPEALVGATDWCTHPPGLDVTRVRGTKNPDLAAVARLRPQLVLANQEENRRLDVERLRSAGIPVWVTVIRTLDEAFASLRRMFTVGLGWPEPGWLGEAERAWAAPPAGPRLRAVIPVWRDPWMVVGSDTFTGDLAARLGLDNVYGGDPGRYPHVTLDDLEARRPDIVVLPDEPYVFGPADGPEAFPARLVALVEGRSLTWYGPSLRTARSLLAEQLAAALPAREGRLSGQPPAPGNEPVLDRVPPPRAAIFARKAVERERSAERLSVSGVEQLPVPFGYDLNGAVDHFDGRVIVHCVRRHR